MAALPHISLRLHGGQSPAASVELAVAADRAGLRTVWFAENPFGRGVLPAMAACAAATRRVRLGIGVFNPFNRHPTLIAMETAALEELAAGRVALGVGAGIGRRVRQMGLAWDRPIGAMRDTVAIVRGLLAGGEVTHAGRVFSAANSASNSHCSFSSVSGRVDSSNAVRARSRADRRAYPWALPSIAAIQYQHGLSHRRPVRKNVWPRGIPPLDSPCGDE